MHITVSSSLEGRDLALLKSVINILEPGGFDATATHWNYKDTSNHHIYVTQDFHNEGCEYYALIKAEEKRITIGNHINPKILRQLFGQLAEGKLSSNFETEPYFSDGYSVNILSGAHLGEHLYHYMSSQSQLNANLDYQDDNRIFIDKANDKIYCTEPLNDSLARKLVTGNNISLKLSEKRISIDRKNYQHQMEIQHFLWILGFALGERLLLIDFDQANIAFRQATWPDYGRLPCKSSFFLLSALIWRGPETFTSLLSREQFNKEDLIAFINASCLSGYTIVNREKEDIKVALNKNKPDKNSFLSRLKLRLFGKKSSG